MWSLVVSKHLSHTHAPVIMDCVPEDSHASAEDSHASVSGGHLTWLEPCLEPSPAPDPETGPEDLYLHKLVDAFTEKTKLLHWMAYGFADGDKEKDDIIADYAGDDKAVHKMELRLFVLMLAMGNMNNMTNMTNAMGNMINPELQQQATHILAVYETALNSRLTALACDLSQAAKNAKKEIVEAGLVDGEIVQHFLPKVRKWVPKRVGKNGSWEF
jgi:hypothetical protein